MNVIGEVRDDDDIRLGTIFNSSEDIMSTAKNIAFAPQLSQDPTCMLLTDHPCSKCGAPTRFIRDSSKRPIFICSNGKCRFVSEV